MLVTEIYSPPPILLMDGGGGSMGGVISGIKPRAHAHTSGRVETEDLFLQLARTPTGGKAGILCERQLTDHILLFRCRRRLPITQTGAWNRFSVCLRVCAGCASA